MKNTRITMDKDWFLTRVNKIIEVKEWDLNWRELRIANKKHAMVLYTMTQLQDHTIKFKDSYGKI